MPSFTNRFEKMLVKALVHGQRRRVFGVGAHRDGRAVRIGAGHHQHVVAAQAMIARKNIGGQVRPDDVADVNLGVGIRPRDTNQNFIGHDEFS